MATLFLKTLVTLAFDDVPDEATACAVGVTCSHHPGNRVAALRRKEGVFVCEGKDPDGNDERHEHPIPSLWIASVDGHVMTVVDRSTGERKTYEGRLHAPPPKDDDGG